MSDIKELTTKIKKFRDKRDWKKFHNPKDVSLSLLLEAAELLEHFQWKSSGEVEKYAKENKDAIGDEIADVAIYLLGLTNDLGLDLKKIIEKKLKKNEKKYPVKKSKGKHTKYTKL